MTILPIASCKRCPWKGYASPYIHECVICGAPLWNPYPKPKPAAKEDA